MSLSKLLRRTTALLGTLAFLSSTAAALAETPRPQNKIDELRRKLNDVGIDLAPDIEEMLQFVQPQLAGG